MKLNIAYPATGCQKMIEVEDENKLRAFYDKRMSAEVDGGALGDEFKEYVFRIMGGNDLQGFPMKQGVLTTTRVRLLLSKGHSCYRPRREGERKRKSVRGCVVSSEISALNLVIVKKGPNEIPGLTDTQKPRRLGPKRASKIRKLFNLSPKDDLTQHVVKRRIAKEGKKAYYKKPKIQRLVTPQRLQRKRAYASTMRKRHEKSKAEAKAYNELIASKFKEQKDKRGEEVAKRRGTQGKDGKEEQKTKDKKPEKKEKKDDKKKPKPKTDKKEKKEEKKDTSQKQPKPKKERTKSNDQSQKQQPQQPKKDKGKGKPKPT